MRPAIQAIEALLTGLTVLSMFYYGLCILAAALFFRGQDRAAGRGPLPPVTMLIPVSEAEPGAGDTYVRFCRQDYPEYQVLFGACDAGDSAVAAVKKVIEGHPGRDIELVISNGAIGENRKVNSLENMLRHAKHETIVMVDSDIRIRPDYLRDIVPLLADPRVGLVTCLYRSAGASTFAARLESVGLTAEFAPRVLMARFLEGVKFALGSTMATTRQKLESIGGFRALANYLADDYMLGKLMTDAGYEVRISRHIVDTLVEPSGMLDMAKHQLRWARSTRFSRPAGYVGLILSYGTPIAILNCLAAHASFASLVLLGSALGLRIGMAWLVAVHWLDDVIVRKNFWMLPVRDVFSFLIWCRGLTGRTVEWRRSEFEILDDGKIKPVAGQPATLRPPWEEVKTPD